MMNNGIVKYQHFCISSTIGFLLNAQLTYGYDLQLCRYTLFSLGRKCRTHIIQKRQSVCRLRRTLHGRNMCLRTSSAFVVFSLLESLTPPSCRLFFNSKKILQMRLSVENNVTIIFASCCSVAVDRR